MRLTMNMVAMGNLRHRRKRYVTLFISILLAMTFAGGAPFFLSCHRSSAAAMKARQVGSQQEITVHAQDVDWAESSWYIRGEVGFSYSILYGWTGDRQNQGTAVAWMDNRAKELYHNTVKEGRWPEVPGEIAIETNALLRMGYSTELGQKITLHTRSMDGRAMEDRSFTVVGLLYDHRSNIERNKIGDWRQMVKAIPAAFVCPQEPGSGYEDQTAFYNSIPYMNYSPEIREKLEQNLAPESIATHYYYAGYSNDPMRSVTTSVQVSMILSILVAFLCCCGIANAFAGNLKERKTQIGMLRAIGATRQQIIKLFGREAVVLCLLTVPLSMCLSYGGVKLFSLVMGENFVFSPDWKAMLIGVLVSVLCVLLSAIVPLLVISRISPMQAIRDVEKMRRMKKHKIHSRKSFELARLLAKRKLMFSRGRQILTGIILTTAVALGCMMAASFQEKMNWIPRDTSDFCVSLNSWSGGINPFVNQLDLNPEISQTMAQEVLSLPMVERVSGETELYSMNILRENPEDYFLLHEYQNGLLFLHGFEPVDVTTMEQLRQLYGSPVSAQGQEILEALDYEGAFFNLRTAAYSEERIRELEAYPHEGTINIDKLNSGEEILIAAPQKIGAYCKRMPDGAASWALLDMNEKELELRKVEQQYIWATADRPFKVGDTLTVSMITEDSEGVRTRQDRKVKVGAILSRAMRGGLMFYTTTEGLRNWYPDVGYQKMDIYLNQTVTEDLNLQMQELLELMFPGRNVHSEFTSIQQTQAEHRMILTFYVAAMLTLISASAWLINNGITAQIREETHSLGTLRAVGAQPRDLIRSYLVQILTLVFWATAAGLLIALGSWLFDWYFYHRKPLLLWPGLAVAAATLAACMLNLWIQIRKISRCSIVDNIRQL